MRGGEGERMREKEKERMRDGEGSRDRGGTKDALCVQVTYCNINNSVHHLKRKMLVSAIKTINACIRLPCVLVQMKRRRNGD